MNVEEAVNKGKQTNQTAKQKYLAKMFSRPVSMGGILQFMADQLTLNNYGPMPPINKKNKGMINGFIKFLRNNGFSDQEIYEFVQKCVENWGSLLHVQMFTDNRKPYTLNTLPDIIDIVICKTCIYKELNMEKEGIIDENEDLWAAWGET